MARALAFGHRELILKRLFLIIEFSNTRFVDRLKDHRRFIAVAFLLENICSNAIYCVD